jgi:hypothetical protein
MPPAPPVTFAVVPAGTKPPPPPPEVVKPLTPDLRRLNVTVSADFMAELQQVRAALSHKCPSGDFEAVVREAFKLVLERDRKRKALTVRPRAQSETTRENENDRYVPAAVERGLGARPRALYLADGKTTKMCAARRTQPLARVRPRSRGGPRRQAHDRKHPAALQKP